MKQILCMRWGTRYGVDYVNRLYNMVARNITPPFRFICMTDDPQGVRSEVECLDCPNVPEPARGGSSGWRKLALWQPELEGVEGQVLFLDLDVVIVANIDDLFTYGEGFCVMRNASQPRQRIGNTSVFRFTAGGHPEVWGRFIADPQAALREYDNDQDFISLTIDRLTFFPDTWCRLFKVHCVPAWPWRYFVPPRLPDGAKIVAFPGQPNPPDAAVGHWPARGFKRLYKRVRPATWIGEHWA